MKVSNEFEFMEFKYVHLRVCEAMKVASPVCAQGLEHFQFCQVHHFSTKLHDLELLWPLLDELLKTYRTRILNLEVAFELSSLGCT